MPSHNNKGRSKHGGFVKIDSYIFRSEAWKEMTPREVMIWLLLCSRYNGRNNGRIGLSIRDAAKQGKMSQGTASKSIKKLIELGFIKKTFEGSFSQKQNFASEFALTHQKVGDASATKEFASWKPKKKMVPKQKQNGIKLGAMSNDNVV